MYKRNLVLESFSFIQGEKKKAEKNRWIALVLLLSQRAVERFRDKVLIY